MAKYRKRPVMIDAEQFFQDEYDVLGTLPPGACDCKGPMDRVHCHTARGVLGVSDTDWVLIGLAGMTYPVHADIFAGMYELAEERRHA